VVSLNRPGGNVTGVALLSAEIGEKRLELLHKAVPVAETIALLVGPADGVYGQAETRHMQSAARTLGLRLLFFSATKQTGMATAPTKRSIAHICKRSPVSARWLAEVSYVTSGIV
jgi:putative ABC transport system substrate-binding protein